MDTKILILGACGQIGTELTLALRKRYGNERVIASDIRKGDDALMAQGVFEYIDATDKNAVKNCIEKHRITDVYLMAAMLSVTAEKFPEKAWNLNINSLLIILDLAKEKRIRKVFFPSSIAVFGPSSPKIMTPQKTVMEPTTVYGISKLTGERWCEYYFKNFDVDVRSIRYPGLISWKTNPGGGTTDYAVEIYHKAIKEGRYECFLQEDTILPMMYIDDAVRATIELMNTSSENLTIRSSYNIAAISFSPKELAMAIKNHIPSFSITYNPDFRQQIAESWTKSIDDSQAKTDWNWEATFNLEMITKDMMLNLNVIYNKEKKLV